MGQRTQSPLRSQEVAAGVESVAVPTPGHSMVSDHQATLASPAEPQHTRSDTIRANPITTAAPQPAAGVESNQPPTRESWRGTRSAKFNGRQPERRPAAVPARSPTAPHVTRPEQADKVKQHQTAAIECENPRLRGTTSGME